MPDEQSERMRRIDWLLKELSKVTQQAADLHRMATELHHGAAAAIRATEGIAPKATAADRPRSRRKAKRKKRSKHR